VIAECRLVPTRYAHLGFNTSGLVAEVLIKEGESVAAGQVLAHLSNQEQLMADVTAAELEVLEAQQALDNLSVNAPLDAAEAYKAVIQAPIDVKNAQTNLDNLQHGEVSDADIDIARANVAFAEKTLNDAEDAYRPWENKPENNLTRASLLTKLAEAQKNYDKVVRRLNSLLGNASEEDIVKAEAELALAKAQQAEAERRYAILKNGPDPNEVALAEARLANAEARLASARANLGNLELRAPFAGTVVSIDLEVGEYVTPGTPLLMMADFSNWTVETTNLTELSVVRIIEENNPATITFDALPGQEFSGKVARIKGLGENSEGDITYTADIQLEQEDVRLRWNMTCSVVIETRQS
jgi:multidrug resistance efflux pump